MTAPVSDNPPRADILHDALRLTLGSRNEEYGKPHTNLDNVAHLWTAYLESKYGGKIPSTQETRSCFALSAEDVAFLNVLQKIGRTFTGHVKIDTYTDAAAYCAIAGECALEDTHS